MPNYIVFLRGINVSGQKKIKMLDLKGALCNAGLSEVKTYIQSGNLVISSEKTSNQVKKIVQNGIAKNFGFEVPALVKTVKEIESILKFIPFQNANEKQLYFTLWYEKPSDGLLQNFEQYSYENEDFHIAEACVYLNCKKGAGKAKLNNNLIEKKLGVTVTTRNLNTMRKMLELAQ